MTYPTSRNPRSAPVPTWKLEEIESQKLLEGEAADSGHTNPARKIIACIMIFMLSGCLATLAYFSSYFQWAVLAITWLAILFTGKLDMIKRMPKAAVIYVAWFIFIVAWGVMGSPITPLYSGVRAIGIGMSAMFIVWITGSDKDTWRFAAMIAPLGIILNLFVTYLLMTNGAIRAWFLVHDMLTQESSTSFRYGGLWGNANEAGLQTIALILLSLWGPRWTAIVGFLCGTVMIFVTASRTSTYAFLGLFLLFGYYFFRSSKQFRVAIGIVTPLLALFILYGALPQINQDQLTSSTTHSTSVAIARVFDPFESHTDQADTRAANFHNWVDRVDRMPWYGYGFNAESGTAPSNPDAGHHELPWLGTHDEYLGVLVDNGPVGLVGFVVAMLAGLYGSLRAKISAWNRAVLLSLWFVVLVFGGFAHALHLLPHGDILLMLCFLAPGLPAMYQVHANSAVEKAPDRYRQPEVPAAADGAFAGTQRIGTIITPGSTGGFRRPGRVRADGAEGPSGAHGGP